MKLHVFDRQVPWITLEKQLWEYYSKTSYNNDLEIVSPTNADAVLLEWTDGITLDDKYWKEKPIFLFVGSLDEHQVESFTGFLKTSNIAMVLSDSIPVCDMLYDLLGINTRLWYRPSKVQAKLMYNGTQVKTNDISIVCNGERYVDNLAEIIKAYFSVSLIDDGEQLVSPEHAVNIFSAQEIPFDVFNNIRFNGLQPNPLVLSYIRRSKLFISPYRGNGLSSNIIDAIMLGTPVMLRDTNENRRIFDEFSMSEISYFNENNLKNVLTGYINMDVDGVEYKQIVDSNFCRVYNKFSIGACFISLSEIVKEIMK